jgi:hypothetical protein
MSGITWIGFARVAGSGMKNESMQILPALPQDPFHFIIARRPPGTFPWTQLSGLQSLEHLLLDKRQILLHKILVRCWRLFQN